MAVTPLPEGPAPARSASGYVLRLDAGTRTALAAQLNAEERRVLLEHGTERPFCGTLLDNKRDGTYVCRLCRLPLFASHAKFDSGTGWPSFFAPFDPHHIRYLRDTSHGMVRIEIRCQRCDCHLGHVFPDGPPPDMDVGSAEGRRERPRPPDMDVGSAEGRRERPRPTDMDVGSAEGRRERPRPTGWRYCLNSIAMGFREQGENLLDAAELASL